MMDWIVGGMIFIGTLWLAAQELRQDAEQVNRCEHCGTGLEITEPALELISLGWPGALPASCPDCGTRGQMQLAMQGQEPWVQ